MARRGRPGAILLAIALVAGCASSTPTAPDDAPRTGKAACDGAVFPMGYGLDVSGAPLGAAACP